MTENEDIKQNQSKTSDNSNDKSALKATIWYLICDFILRGMSFITMPIFTRMMTTGEIGSYSILNSWISILSIVVTLNLIQSVFLAKYDYKENYNEFASAVAILGMISATACYLVLFPFRGYIADFIGVELYAYDIMGIHLIFCQMSNVLVAKFRANLDYRKSVIFSLSTTIFITISAVICTIRFTDSLKGRVYGTYIPTVVINIIIFVFVLYRKGSFKTEYCKYALAICTPLIIHNLAGNIMHSSDRIMIGKMCSNSEAGLYGVAYTCAMFTNVLRNSMNTAWNPWVFDKLHDNKTNEIKRASYVYLISFFLLCIGIIALAPDILFILGGKPYLTAKYVVPPVVTAYMFSMVYSLYAGIEQYYKKQKYFAVVATICASLNVILNYICIPIWGYMAAAYTTLFCSALECLLHFINVRKMGYSRIYSTYFNVILLIITLGVSGISIVVYSNNIIRYVVISVLIIFCIMLGIIRRVEIKMRISDYLNKKR